MHVLQRRIMQTVVISKLEYTSSLLMNIYEGGEIVP